MRHRSSEPGEYSSVHYQYDNDDVVDSTSATASLLGSGGDEESEEGVVMNEDDLLSIEAAKFGIKNFVKFFHRDEAAEGQRAEEWERAHTFGEKSDRGRRVRHCWLTAAQPLSSRITVSVCAFR